MYPTVEARMSATATAVLLGVLLPAIGSAAACPPAVQLAGPDPAVVADVILRLEGRGVSTRAPPGCESIEVLLTSREAGYRAVLDLPDGRRVTREVPGLETLVALVESYSRPDLTAGLLVPPAPPPPPPPPAPRLQAVAPEPSVPAFATAAQGLGYYGSDDSVWAGAELQGALRYEPVWLGATLGAFADTGARGDVGSEPLRRLAVRLGLEVEHPLEGAFVTVAPALGVGVSWLRTTYDGPDEHEVLDGGGVQGRARLALRRPVARALAAEVGLVFDVTPLARTEREDPDDPIPGEPLWWAGLALGLRYGGGAP